MTEETTMRQAGPAHEEFRAHFPVLADTVHLASCSLAPRSRPLDEAMEHMLATMARDPTPWDMWIGAVERSRQRFARMINASPEQVAIVPSATVGAYQVASTQVWRDRPRIVTTDVEYSSVAQIWSAQRPRGAEIVSVPEHGHAVAAEDYLHAVDERTGLVSVPLLSYHNGARMPVAEVTEAAHRLGARVFVDAYQAAGVVPIDVAELGCDYLVTGVMKYLLGIPGIAYLYVKDGLPDAIDPQLTGWYGRGNPLSFDPRALDFPPDARRFQVNMPTLPAALAADRGLELIGGLDLARVERHVGRLVGQAAERLREGGVPLAMPEAAGAHGPQVAVAAADPMALAHRLNQRRVFPARGNVVRLSFHYFNDESDLDAACAAIEQYSRENGVA